MLAVDADVNGGDVVVAGLANVVGDLWAFPSADGTGDGDAIKKLIQRRKINTNYWFWIFFNEWMQNEKKNWFEWKRRRCIS